MIRVLRLIVVFLCSSLVESVVLKTAMENNFSQVALPGCDTHKPNIFYDRKSAVWKEDLFSSCETTVENILDLCQKVYPSLDVTNILPLSKALSFGNWCELIPPSNGNGPVRCQLTLYHDQSVMPYRCLHSQSDDEESSTQLARGCTRQQFNDPARCSSIYDWEDEAVMHCDTRGEVLASSLKPLTSCGLGQFQGVKFDCCSIQSLKQQSEPSAPTKSSGADEDDAIEELIVVPTQNKRDFELPKDPWIPDLMQKITNDDAFFANDEDLKDEKRSRLIMDEHRRFTEAKEKFREKYQNQVKELQSQWEIRLADIQASAKKDGSAAQRDYENSDLEFRGEYDRIQREASRERARINGEHEQNLDAAIAHELKRSEEKLNHLWNTKPRPIDEIGKALYHYVHTLLRDRIHLVNRYERLRAVDPDQAQRKRIPIHERLFVIEKLINQALAEFRKDPILEKKTRPQINELITEYEEVNVQAKKLLNIYRSVMETTTARNRRLPDSTPEEFRNPFLSTELKSKSSSSILSKPLISSIVLSLLILLLILAGLCLLRYVLFKRRTMYSSHASRTCTFVSDAARSPDDETLRALQVNGYENPTYKFFEKQNPRC